jgi:organic radical activating enzyme
MKGLASPMIGVSKIYCGEASDPLRHGRRSRELPSRLLQFSEDKKPVVVWNLTKASNLPCCASAKPGPAGDEIGRDEARRLGEDLTDYGVSVILFSGGEPARRPHLKELVEDDRRPGLASEALNAAETGAAIGIISEKALTLHRQGRSLEALTVGNQADGPCLYRKLLAAGLTARAESYHIFNEASINEASMAAPEADPLAEPREAAGR